MDQSYGVNVRSILGNILYSGVKAWLTRLSDWRSTPCVWNRLDFYLSKRLYAQAVLYHNKYRANHG